MGIKQVADLIEQWKLGKRDGDLAAEYNRKLYLLLSENGYDEYSTEIIMEGIDIDQGATFIQYLEEKKEKDFKKIWNLIDESQAFMRDDNANALKLLCVLLRFSLNVNSRFLCKNIIQKFYYKAYSYKDQRLIDSYEKIIETFFVKKVDLNSGFPNLNDVGCKIEDIQKFTKVITYTLNSMKQENGGVLSDELEMITKWLDINVEKKNFENINLSDYKEKELNKSSEKEPEEKTHIKTDRKVEKKVVKKSDVLRRFADAYDKIEKELVIEKETITIKNQIINELNEKINVLYNEKAELQILVNSLKADKVKIVADKEKLESKLKDSSDLNSSLVTIKQQSEQDMLLSIASSLKSEYTDYMESVDDTMDLELGEIYREKIKNMFKILERKGIRVE